MSGYCTAEVNLTVAYGFEYIRARLVYDVCAPLEVQLCLQGNVPGEGEVVWTFARDLLIDGLRERSGIGDVHVWPLGEEDIIVSVNGMDDEAEVKGWADMVLRREPVTRFLGQSFKLVPQGAESRFMRIDAELADFLGAS